MLLDSSLGAGQGQCMQACFCAAEACQALQKAAGSKG